MLMLLCLLSSVWQSQKGQPKALLLPASQASASAGTGQAANASFIYFPLNQSAVERNLSVVLSCRQDREVLRSVSGRGGPHTNICAAEASGWFSWSGTPGGAGLPCWGGTFVPFEEQQTQMRLKLFFYT